MAVHCRPGGARWQVERLCSLEKRAACHGGKGEGLTADRLAGRNAGDDFNFATDTTLQRTVGSYWPYATTLFDYTRRAMPQPAPGSLTDNETYSLVAYLLFLNGIVDSTSRLLRAMEGSGCICGPATAARLRNSPPAGPWTQSCGRFA